MVGGIGVLELTVHGEAKCSAIRMRPHRAHGDVIALVHPPQLGDVPRDATPRWNLDRHEHELLSAP